MLVSRAPVRIDLAGGTTDISPFCDIEGGAVVNATITLYAHASIKTTSNGSIIVRSEDFDTLFSAKGFSELKYDGNLDLVKAVLRRLTLPIGIELRLWSDVPPGSGLGSSAAMGVALLGLLSQAFDLGYTKTQIAELEFTLETEELGITGGKQDQYAVVFGGVSYMRFTQDGVQVTPLQLSPEVLSKLESCLILCYTGASRLSGDVNQKMIKAYMRGVTSVVMALRQIKAIVEDIRDMLLATRLDALGELLNAEYRNRIQLTPEVITPKMQLLRDVAFQNGASGAKICGAGGGGCMLFTCDKQAKQQVISQLVHVGGQILPFQFEDNGLQVFNSLKPHQH